jgi:hypothetical protein
MALPDDLPQLEETADVERHAEVLLKHRPHPVKVLGSWVLATEV